MKLTFRSYFTEKNIHKKNAYIASVFSFSHKNHYFDIVNKDTLIGLFIINLSQNY